MNDEVAVSLSEFPFPLVVNLFTKDTSQFQKARDVLVSLGLIPKPLAGYARPLEERTRNAHLPWEQEECCVLPVSGMEYLAETEFYGWGIYRAVFRGPVVATAQSRRFGIENTHPHVEFKYCIRHTPRKYFIERSIPPNDPMKEHIRKAYELLQPTSVVDQLAQPISCPY
ncbi:MAG: hypothetical protein V1743_03825 [Nanoarchaeota archaeon]